MVVVLFARADSVYKRLGADVYDLARDARTYSGDEPVIAHPPCRSWGRLAHMAKPRPGERDLALFALEQVRRCGGVLEHPEASRLWYEARLPPPGGLPDQIGGRTLVVDQCDFGHRARKRTWLYYCHLAPVPLLPHGGVPSTTVERLSRAAREHTPEPLARWLMTWAKTAQPPAI